MRSVGEVNAREGEDEGAKLLWVEGGERASVVGVNEGGEVVVLLLVLMVVMVVMGALSLTHYRRTH